MSDKGCQGCSWIDDGSENWCEMFSNKPSELPCAQHDIFNSVRRITGKMIGDNPILLTGMVIEAAIRAAKKSKT